MRQLTPVLRPLRTVFLAAILVAPLAACYAWRSDARPVTAVVRDASGTQLRLRRADGSAVVLRAPRLVTDTSVVLGTGSDTAGSSDTLVAGRLVSRTLASGEIARGGGRRDAVVLVRLSDIRRVELRQLQRWRTVAGLGVLAAFLAVPLFVRPANR